MIKLTAEFLKNFANAAQAKLGRTFDIHTDEGIQQLQALAQKLIENPDDEITTSIVEHINEQPEQRSSAFHPGFMPKIDYDFHLDEKNNYFRRGKSFVDPDDLSPKR